MLNNLATRLKVSERLGDRYRIHTVLGAGGMGAVYLAEDLKLKGKRWAIKESIKPSEDAQRFIDEAEILIKLNHPYLPNIIDYFPPDSDGYSYLVMDYVEGQTLLQVFEQQQRNLSFDRILTYCIQICDLFCYLHGHQPKPIIYRDLKPSNVMIDQQDNVRLIDFGIARNYKIGHHSDTIPMGTIGFAAPEQFEQLQTDNRTDLYNLGAMMYYLLSRGHYYYIAQKPISDYRDDLPMGLVHMLNQLLMTNPTDRYQSTAEVRRELESFYRQAEAKPATEISTHPMMKSKVIVVGSLYAGAGSTFVTMSLAGALHHCQISNAIIEYPIIEPELYSLLFGEKSMPKDYLFLVDQLHSDDRIGPRIEWTRGKTTWYPMDPKESERSRWNAEKSYKLLYIVKNPIIVIDVSGCWEDSGVQELCMEADEILFVVDAFPHKFNKDSSQRRFDYAYQLKKLRKSVNFVANRDLDSFARREWLKSFPWRPICRLPNIPYEDMTYAVWKGKLVQDQPEIFSKLFKAMYPLLAQIVPNDYLTMKDGGEKSCIFSKWVFEG